MGSEMCIRDRNYAQLQSNIADFLNRTDLAAVIPTFIGLTEAQMERALRVRQMIGRSTAPIDTEYGALPPDFLEAKTFKITSSRPIQPVEFVTPEQMDDAQQLNANAQGIPKYFTIIGGQIRVHPVPDATYTGEMTYFTKLDKLSNSNTCLLYTAPSPRDS